MLKRTCYGVHPNLTLYDLRKSVMQTLLTMDTNNAKECKNVEPKTNYEHKEKNIHLKGGKLTAGTTGEKCFNMF